MYKNYNLCEKQTGLHKAKDFSLDGSQHACAQDLLAWVDWQVEARNARVCRRKTSIVRWAYNYAWMRSEALLCGRKCWAGRPEVQLHRKGKEREDKKVCRLENWTKTVTQQTVFFKFKSILQLAKLVHIMLFTSKSLWCITLNSLLQKTTYIIPPRAFSSPQCTWIFTEFDPWVVGQ